MTEMPDRIELSVDEALLLVIALEDAAGVLDRLMRRQPLQMTDLIAPLAGIEEQLRLLDSKLGWTEGDKMPTEILRLAEAARRLGITTAEIVRMVHERRIEYVVVDGIVRIPDTVVENLKRQKAS